ncbi:MAG: alpha-2-macroglobulin [Azospirillaceae bacterium]|nr:alpha-2-macroglobulin [Azospirillaceae bacterium]
MTRLLPFVLALALILVGGSSHALDLPGLQTSANAYETAVRDKAPPQPQLKVQADALGRAAEALKQGQPDAAIPAFEQAIKAGDDRAETWLALSEAWTAAAKPNPQRALQAAWLALGKSNPAHPSHVAALDRLAALLEGPLNRPRDALHALQEHEQMAKDDATVPVPADLESRISALKRRIGLEIRKVVSDTGADPARICVTFTDPLLVDAKAHYGDYVKLEPAATVVPQVEDDTLCLAGVAYGTGYQLTLRAGLPGDQGLVLNQEQVQRVDVGDRVPMVAFQGNGFILPRGGADGLPLSTVNVAKVDLSVVRINDRNLVPLNNHGVMSDELYDYAFERLKSRDGEGVWQGSVAIKGSHNGVVVTPVPMRALMGDPKPGIYLVRAQAADPVSSGDAATQWVVVSDIGLTAYKESDGITVYARSYGTAKPLAGIPVALVASNNAELARAPTDGDGRVRFAVPKGEHDGNNPAMVMAYGLDNDYAMLDLAKAAFDLSDRGVSGRDPPGPLDAFLYTDRGVYRPGERVNLTVLLRDDKTRAVEDFPLTLKVLRPGGSVFFQGVVKPGAAGAQVLPLDLTTTAPFGMWTVNAYGDPKADPIGRVEFDVEDFVPERLAVEIQPSAAVAVAARAFPITVHGRFLYGPPAAGLTGREEVTVEADPTPFPAFKDYQFGATDEEVAAKTAEIDVPALDATGSATVAAVLPAIPDATRPLVARIRVAVAEPGGRPSRAEISVPVANQSFAIGIKPLFDNETLAENASAGFNVIAVDPSGTPVAQTGLTAKLSAEHSQYQWYSESGRFTYRTITRREPIKSVALAVAAAQPTGLDLGKLPFGRYRLEVADQAGAVTSSIRFWVGWQDIGAAADIPDKLVIAADQAAYLPGATARLRITPPFAGELLVTVATDHVLSTQTLTVPTEGVTLDVPVAADWGPGAYVLATAYRSPQAGRDHQPVRALGLTWVAVDPAPRTLKVALDAPADARPRGPIPVTVRVTGGDGAPAAGAYVTLAAVDEGILHLTGFKTPDPGGFFNGKRRLGVLIHDDYGHLIDPALGPPGELRQGGDSLGASLPAVPVQVVSLFQGPVRLDDQGVARLTVNMPDFDGQVRLMAVAFDRQRVGATAAPLTVHEPLVAQMALPRFLAPGDESRVTVSLHAVDAPAGAYHVVISGAGSVAVDDGIVDLGFTGGDRQTVIRTLRGVTPGIGTVQVAVTGPNGLKVDHSLSMTVRSVRPLETHFDLHPIDPGASVQAGSALLAGFIPGTGAVRLGFSAAPPIDIGGIVTALENYPYRCLEQTVSTAAALLVRDRLGIPDPDGNAAAGVQQAIARLTDLQRFDGGFGLWSGRDEANRWLSAYAMDFLTRARAKGVAVPSEAYLNGLDFLRNVAANGGTSADGLAARAYAVEVLSAAGLGMPGTTRLLGDESSHALPTPLARGQVAAALVRLGETERAQRLVDAALGQLARKDWGPDYGSTIRDAAALIPTLGEAGLLGDHLPALIDRLPANDTAAARTSTQEQAWLVMAVASLSQPQGARAAGQLSLTRNGRPWTKADPAWLVPTAADLSQGITIANAGTAAIWQASSVAGIPIQPAPAAREGLRIRRNFLNRDGTAYNLDQMHQNDVFVIVLEGEANTGLDHQLLVTHGLAAGWEIENPSLGGDSTKSLAWLGDLSPVVAVEARDDRFAAALDLTPQSNTFRLAYLVRVVTPGNYELPGAAVEDMQKPRFFARQAVGRVTVQPAP